MELANKMLLKAIELDESYAHARAVRAWNLAMLRKYDEALSEVEKAYQLAPGNSSVGYWYGTVLAVLGRAEEAIPLFQKAIRLNPLGPSFLYREFGDVLRDTGRLDEAVAAYTKGIRIAPDDMPAHVALAITYIFMGHEEKARAEAAEVLRLNPKFSVDTWLKRFPIKDQSYADKAADALRKAGLK